MKICCIFAANFYNMSLAVHPKAKALIFDVDGTLANSMPLHFDAWQHVAAKFGFRYPKDEFLKNAGSSTKEIVARVNQEQQLELDAAPIAKEKANYFFAHLNKMEPIEPVVQILKSQYGKMPVSAGTGGRRHVAVETLALAGLTDYLPILVTADDVEFGKPHPETFLKCAEYMGVEPAACQVFEDGELGLQAARTAGMIATDVRPYV